MTTIPDPMLAVPFRGDVEQAMMDDDLWFEQKLDGERVMVHISSEGIEARSRTGFDISLDISVDQALETHFGDTEWIFDGEYLDGVYWIFDVLMINGTDTTGVPLEARKNGLVKVFDRIEKPGAIRLIRAARTPEDKHILYEKTLTGNHEGVIIKDRTRPYFAGKRSRWWLKVKHIETADVVVLETGRGTTGRAVTIGMYKDGELVEVAGCKIPKDELLSEINDGMVLEVKYLYATPDGRLYQPVFHRIRTDKLPEECLLEGLKMPNKQAVNL